MLSFLSWLNIAKVVAIALIGALGQIPEVQVLIASYPDLFAIVSALLGLGALQTPPLERKE